MTLLTHNLFHVIFSLNKKNSGNVSVVAIFWKN